MRPLARRTLVTALAGLPAATAARAQSGAAAWPSRPVRVVVPYPPGGPTDIMARIVAQGLTRDLPQPVVVENRSGASGTIGCEAVARAAPDGTTFLANASAHVIVPHLLPNLSFDAVADFAPVTNIAAVPLILVVTPSLPVRSVAELIAYAKANPGRLNYASSSSGGAPHLAGELFKQLAGVQMTHVPYRGSGQALPDLIAGNVQVMFDSMPSSAPSVREGRLRALAVTTAHRISAFPDLPTVAEAGPVPGYEIATWYGIWAPARTPAPIVQRLQQAVATVLRGEEARQRLAALGAEPVGDTPEQFDAFARREYERWGKLVRDADIRAE
ncbi:MAG: tripartite tricarboxylate transporter substrate binding protein [Acetobacteraceae bacterium]|nr:tripartite tricarboxylate transporter substrate binding protein [Acetobacteraceae bacterium]